jgi:translation initiation factor 3 subunit M
MPAVTQLENDGKHALIYQLLKIFLTQRLNAFMEFHSGNPAVLQNYGLVHDECVSKMRLITLLDLASHAPSAQIPYSRIRDSLQVSVTITFFLFFFSR